MTRLHREPPNGHTAGPSAARRARRFDPERRERILDATLDVLAEHGVSGLTHRLIAAQADVPLGSVTYHFSSLADLRAQAFERFVAEQSMQFEQLFQDVRNAEQLVEILTDLVHASPSRRRSARLGFELHLAALRDPELRALTTAWTEHSRRVMARFTSSDNADRLDALLEGMIMHSLLSTVPEPREKARAAIARTLDEDYGAGS